jgi:hypothetical protein
LAPAGLVDWWPLDGDGNDLAGSLSATPQNGVDYTNGVCGQALHLDGLTGGMIPGGASLPPPWTVCLWVNRQNASETSATLLADGVNTLQLERDNLTRQVGVSIGGQGDYTFGCSVPQNTWTHLALVGTSAGTTVYLNADLTGTHNPLPVSLPLPLVCLGLDFHGVADAIGSKGSYQFTNHLKGSLDEMQVFNRALSAAEISAIYSAGSAGLVSAPEFTGIAAAGGGQIQLSLRGLTGRGFTLYTSTNWVDWTSPGSVANPTGTVQCLDATAVGSSYKFYRASQP